MVGLIASDSKLRMAIVLHEKGKWQEAEETNREVLEVTGRVLGGGHPDTLSSMEGLAGTVAFRDREGWQFRWFLEGDSHSGRLLIQLTSCEHQLQRSHRVSMTSTRTCLDLAALLVQMNEESEIKEAEVLLRQTVPALQRQYGFKMFQRFFDLNRDQALGLPVGRAGEGCRGGCGSTFPTSRKTTWQSRSATALAGREGGQFIILYTSTPGAIVDYAEPIVRRGFRGSQLTQWVRVRCNEFCWLRRVESCSSTET